MEGNSIRELKNTAVDLRKHVIDMIYKAQSGHPGGSLSVADFVTACYFQEMRVDPKNPKWEDRDRFILSKGHVCPAQYAALAMKGYFGMEVLDTLRKEGSMLQGHPDMKKIPGVDMTSGSLGQGFLGDGGKLPPGSATILPLDSGGPLGSREDRWAGAPEDPSHDLHTAVRPGYRDDGALQLHKHMEQLP